MLTAQNFIHHKMPMINSTLPVSSFNDYNQQDNRVTLRIDVSYIDHGHMIGRGGRTTKAIMARTMTQIHYPDGNRSNSETNKLKIPKSNQVSITGETQGVENARKCIRGSLPLTFCFDLPPVQPKSTFEKMLQEVEMTFCVQVSYTNNTPSVKTVSVKGCVDRCEQTMCATKALIEEAYGASASQVSVKLTTEVDPKNHQFVFKSTGNFAKYVMQKTGANIQYDKSNLVDQGLKVSSNNSLETTNSQLWGSTVTITGSIYSVHIARELLIESLPVTLQFDISSDEYSVFKPRIHILAESYGVEVADKPKVRQPYQSSITLRCSEKHVNKLYEVRSEILRNLRPTTLDNFLKNRYSVNDSYLLSNQKILEARTLNTYMPPTPQYYTQLSDPNLYLYAASIPRTNPMLVLPTCSSANYQQPFTSYMSLPDLCNDASISGSMINLVNSLPNMTETKNNSLNICSYNIQLPILPTGPIHSTPIDPLLKVPEKIPRLDEVNEVHNLSLKTDTSNSANASSCELESDAEMALLHSSSQELDVNLAPGAEYSAKQREKRERSDSNSLMDICSFTPPEESIYFDNTGQKNVSFIDNFSYYPKYFLKDVGIPNISLKRKIIPKMHATKNDWP